jgi:hypothetical protein
MKTMTLIEWTTNPPSINTTTTIPNDGLLRGIGSKQITLNYIGSGCALNVTPNVRYKQDRRQNPYITTPKPWHKAAVIENLIIDGTGSNNATGILLEDVYNCTIRNVTIKNFAVGIKLTATHLFNVITEQGDQTTLEAPDTWEFQNFSEANRIVHVRLEEVGTGILFDSGTGSGSFACTTIDDVDILLQNSSSAIGIQVGTNGRLAQPYSSRIKANIRQQSAGGTGIKLYSGELKFGLINIAVKGPTNGKGVDISNATTSNAVNLNQSFFLSTDGISYSNPDNTVIPKQSNPPDVNDIQVKHV